MSTNKINPEANVDQSKRRFLQASMIAGSSALGLSGLAGCGGGEGELSPQDYFFDLSQEDVLNNEHFLVAGSRRSRIHSMVGAEFEAAKNSFPFLRTVPESDLTHAVDVEVPMNEPQLMYVERVRRGAAGNEGLQVPAAIFLHIPDAAVIRSSKKRMAKVADGDPVGDQHYIDHHATAMTLASFHPELFSLDADAAAAVESHMPGDSLDALAAHIEANNDSYLFIENLTNDDGSQIYNKDENGVDVPAQMWRYTDRTRELVGELCNDVLARVKNDPTLGVDTTNIDPLSVDPLDSNSPITQAVTGKLWTVHDGQTAVELAAPGALQRTTSLGWQTTNLTAGHKGFDARVTAVYEESGLTWATVRITNSYARYLGIFTKYFDEAGNVVTGGLPEGYEYQYGLRTRYFNDDGYIYHDFQGAQTMIYGVPCFTNYMNVNIPIPNGAVSFELCAGGLGNSTGPSRPQSVKTTGQILTGVVCLAVPTMMLAALASSTYNAFMKSISGEPLVKAVGAIGAFGYAGYVLATTTDNPEALANFGATCGKILLNKGMQSIFSIAVIYIGSAKIITAIPFIGMMAETAGAASTLVGIARTSADAALSPSVYVSKVVPTKAVTVSLSSNPPQGTGLLAVTLTTSTGAIFTSKFAPPWPSTGVTIPEIPFSSSFTVAVGAYKGGNDTLEDLIGVAKDVPFENTRSNQSVTLKMENLVRNITASTKYIHKARTRATDYFYESATKKFVQVSPDILEWVPGGQDTFVAYPEGNPEIRELGNITVNPYLNAVGKSWIATDSRISSCGGGGAGSPFGFFGNSGSTWNSDPVMQDTSSPNENYFVTTLSGDSRITIGGAGDQFEVSPGNFVNNQKIVCGLPGGTRIVYDTFGGSETRNYYLDTSTGENIVRQIRLRELKTSKGTYDLPNSNRAFGRLNYKPDALLMHPNGELVAISKSLSKVEVLTPPEQATSDAAAPRASVITGFGSLAGRVDSPACFTITSDGALLVVEPNNKRVQSLDLSGNPIRRFSIPSVPGSYSNSFALKDWSEALNYLDIAVDLSGYMYVLTRLKDGRSAASAGSTLDVYNAQGTWICRTTGICAGRIAVDPWRVLYTLNYKKVSDAIRPWPVIEPQVSIWTPS